jgi:hypothetical protein
VALPVELKEIVIVLFIAAGGMLSALAGENQQRDKAAAAREHFETTMQILPQMTFEFVREVIFSTLRQQLARNRLSCAVNSRVLGRTRL